MRISASRIWPIGNRGRTTRTREYCAVRYLVCEMHRHRPPIPCHKNEVVLFAPAQNVRVLGSGKRGVDIANAPHHEIGSVAQEFDSI
jgi:hypothetical protein